MIICISIIIFLIRALSYILNINANFSVKTYKNDLYTKLLILYSFNKGFNNKLAK